jgi:hypothetical protein
MITAISPSNASSSAPWGRTTSPPSDSDDEGLKKYDGSAGTRPRCAARLW